VSEINDNQLKQISAAVKARYELHNFYVKHQLSSRCVHKVSVTTTPRY